MNNNIYFASNPPALTTTLTKKHFLIAGAGGLGSNVAMMLIRAGAKQLTIIDYDIVEPANLNRQFFFRKQVGQLKVEALKVNLMEINPNINLTLINEKIVAQNIENLISPQADIILECFDCAMSKAMLVAFCLKNLSDKPIITVSGLAGIASLDNIKQLKGPKNLTIIGDKTSEVSQETGTLSSRVMYAASMQAHLAIQLATNTQ